MTEQEQSRDQAVGALLGLAVGDAIGTTISSSCYSLDRRALLAAGARRSAAHKKIGDIVGSALSLPNRMIWSALGLITVNDDHWASGSFFRATCSRYLDERPQLPGENSAGDLCDRETFHL